MPLQHAQYWINRLGLIPHPEGGYYQEHFRSESLVMRTASAVPKSAVTSIWYLLEGNDFSGFHRIASDELWYFHKGASLVIHVLDKTGVLQSKELSDRSTGSLVVAVKSGDWFAAALPGKRGFTLASCAVAPGFEFQEFEMARRAGLIAAYPGNEDLLKRFCRE